MPRTYSNYFKGTIAQVNAAEAPLLLLEINHPALAQPARVVNDNQDVVSTGNVFVASAFRVDLPEDLENQLPRARLAVDNVGEELVYWIETAAGAPGSTCRIMQILRSAPNTIEWEITLDIANPQLTALEVTADLVVENLFSAPAVSLQFRPDTAPGAF